jgi:hypothetical protein
MNDRVSRASAGSAAAPASARSGARLPRPHRPRPARRRLSRRLQRGLVGGAFLAVTSLITVVLLLLRPPHPAALVCLGADYADDLAVPDNALGWNGMNEVAGVADAGGLRGLFSSWRSGKMRLARPAQGPLEAVSAWHEGWGHFPEPVVVVYIDLHGGADDKVDDRGPYLLAAPPHGEQPRSDDGLDQRLYLRDVLEFLRTDGELKAKNKLLILDATKVEAHEPLTLHNDFAAALRKLVERTPDDRLFILSASGENQRSWVSEEWQKSIFARKVIEGLQGAAAGPDNRVTIASLFDYVEGEVKDWAHDNRKALQKPVLLPDSDEARARAARLELVRTVKRPAPPDPREAPGAKFSPPEWLWKEGWEHRDALLRLSPPPYLYANHLWQRYEQTLLRCEALARAGRGPDDPAVARLLQDLTGLEKGIRGASQLALAAALGNSTALADAFEPVAVPPEVEKRFRALWGACTGEGEKADAERLRAALEVGEWVGGRKPARAAFYRWLLTQVVGGAGRPVADAELPALLARAHAASLALDRQGNDRPVEALFLAMLDGHLPAGARPSPLVGRALRLRRRAEEVALGAAGASAGRAGLYEQIAPFLRDDVERGDAERRLGEDYLFAGRPQDAVGHLDSAAKAYDEAAATAGGVRAALWASAEAHAGLPSYCRWLAGPEGRAGAAQKPPLEAAEALWQDLHDLDARLRQGGAEGAAKGRDLGPRADKVRKAYQAIQEAFDAECGLLTPDRDLPDRWRRLEDVLAVPLIGAERRRTLLDNSRKASNALNTKQVSNRANDRAAPDADRGPGEREDKREAELRAWKAARRRGRMALAALGRERYEEAKEFSYQRDFERLAREADDPERGVAVVGRHVSQLLRQEGAELPARTADSHKGTKAEAEAALERAAFLCRRADGRLVPPDLSQNPVHRRRELQTHALLCWLAGRTLLDCWWCESPRGTPYYQDAGRAYLEDAIRLLGDDVGPIAQDGRQKAEALSAALDARHEPTFEFAPAGNGHPVAVTGQRRIRVDCACRVTLPRLPGRQTAAGEPRGVATVRVEAPDLGPEHLPGAAAGPQVREVGPDPAEWAVPLEMNNPYQLELLAPRRDRLPPSRQPIPYRPTWHGLLRGRVVTTPVAVEVHPAADTVVYQLPVPNVAGIAVWPDKEVQRDYKDRRGTLVIVFDNSASMYYPWRAADKQKRIEAATAALSRVLADIPEETVVSVLTFRPDDRDGTKDDSVQVLWEPRPWRQKDRDRLMRQVASLRPSLSSPITRAIWEGKGAFAGAGRKTLLVLTDGDDNCFESDKALQRKLKGVDWASVKEEDKISRFLKETLGRADVSVNMVVFQKAGEDKDRARRQFKQILKEGLDRPGRYFDEDIPDVAALVRALRDALDLRPTYWLSKDEDDFKPPLNAPGQHDLDVLGPADKTYFFYEPGWYELHALAGPRARPQRVELKPGELLLAKLTLGGFRRALLSDLFDDRRPADTDKDRRWRMTALQNSARLDSSRVLLLGLEQVGDPDLVKPVLRRVSPGVVWFELGRRDGTSTPNGASFGEEQGSAVPIWTLEIPRGADWAGVTAWVREGFDGTPVSLDPSARVTVERFTVVDRKGKPLPGVPCLVVRADYDADDPVRALLADTNDPTRVGAEHHYYVTGGRGSYTGVFWFLGAGDKEVAGHAAELRLMSLKRLKAAQGTVALKLSREDLERVSTTEVPGLPSLNLLDHFHKDWAR